MTRREILVRILSEVSGRPEPFVSTQLDIILCSPFISDHTRAALEEELGEKETKQLMAGLRQEREGIRQWLEAGAAETFDKIRKAGLN